MGGLEFRRLEPAHLPAAARIYADCFNAPPWEDGWSDERASYRLEALLAFPTAAGCVALQRDNLVGFALGHAEPWTDGAHFYLNELCVEMGQQRQGIGSALLGHLVCELRQGGIGAVYLLTEHASAAEAFFVQQGFEHDAGTAKLWRDL